MPGGKLKKASESEEAAWLRAAMGVGPDEDVNVQTPAFERTAGMREPGAPPDFGAIGGMSESSLKQLGCQPWDEPDERGTVLMLLPQEWYDAIPEGFAVETIRGQVKKFQRGVTSKERRFGVLAYGVRVRS